jgi:hypothetical protein
MQSYRDTFGYAHKAIGRERARHRRVRKTTEPMEVNANEEAGDGTLYAGEISV